MIHQLQMKKYFPVIGRLIVIVGLLVICLFLVVFSPRVLTTPLAFSVLIAGGFWIKTGRCKGLIYAVTVFLFFALIPIDFRVEGRFGAPKLLPIVNGLPSVAASEAALRGEVLLGSCFSWGYEPRWAVVW